MHKGGAALDADPHPKRHSSAERACWRSADDATRNSVKPDDATAASVATSSISILTARSAWLASFDGCATLMRAGSVFLSVCSVSLGGLKSGIYKLSCLFIFLQPQTESTIKTLFGT